MYGNSINFNRFMERENLDGMKEWLLRGFQESNFAHLPLDSEPSAPVQLQYIFEEKLSPQSQGIFKRATVEATKKWSYPAYSPETLKQLVVLAAYVEAEGIIEVLRELIKSKKLEKLKGKKIDYETTDAYIYTMRYVVGVLQGFAAPGSEVEEVLKEFFEDDDFDPRFAAQLFLGLCECAPKKYVDYVPRFLKLQERHPEYYSMFHVVRGFARIVPLSTIKENFSDLDLESMDRFVHFLCDQDWSPARSDKDQFMEIIEKKFSELDICSMDYFIHFLYDQDWSPAREYLPRFKETQARTYNRDITSVGSIKKQLVPA